MVDINGAYMHGRYEEIWLKSLYIMFNVKVFTMQNGQPSHFEVEAGILTVLHAQFKWFTKNQMIYKKNATYI